MPTHKPRPPLRLTSAADGYQPPHGPDPRALNRALWLQRGSIFAASVVARDIIGTDHTRAKQEALCTELDRLATEARALLEQMPESEGDL